ncbi:hypothetical protein BOW53_06770 [Solemya pervernicosa gill symbiont]|uniref:Uncharacterized protein n=2 Tax=Gammaproteobacteria incertae sedis TaxID=118884 RepID=A0A1T2L6Y0_9GAMM|nr:hypothetical protein [Candidatus Reidiella endopervernicosa]OOZ40706.1 hypothetical protein BOW53_06770 [Solemya pervernicosa gill symbiont]QKQ26774.1 hypothetical protein HUE57_11115 [Candidatus Reidiella endopervernicosa]
MRIKTKWHKDKEGKSLEESASVMGFVAWRAAMNGLNQMENDGFRTDSYSHQLEIIAEFVAFELQVADRLAYIRLEDEDRQAFISTLAGHLIEHTVDNMLDVQGPGDYRPVVIEKLNNRAAEYAELKFQGEEPGYPFLSHLGRCVDGIMGGEKNKFAIEFAAEVIGPDLVKTLRKSVADLLD